MKLTRFLLITAFLWLTCLSFNMRKASESCHATPDIAKFVDSAGERAPFESYARSRDKTELSRFPFLPQLSLENASYTVPASGASDATRTPFSTSGQTDLSRGFYSGDHATVSVGDGQYGMSAGAGQLDLFSSNGISFVKSGTGEFARIDPNGIAHFSGIRTALRVVTGNGKVSPEDSTLLVNPVSSAIEILPDTPSNGQLLSIVNLGSKSIVVVSHKVNIGNASATASTSLTLSSGEAIQLQFDGMSSTKAWRILHKG
jgi:hypothetical protein